MADVVKAPVLVVGIAAVGVRVPVVPENGNWGNPPQKVPNSPNRMSVEDQHNDS